MPTGRNDSRGNNKSLQSKLADKFWHLKKVKRARAAIRKTDGELKRVFSEAENTTNGFGEENIDPVAKARQLSQYNNHTANNFLEPANLGKIGSDQTIERAKNIATGSSVGNQSSLSPDLDDKLSDDSKKTLKKAKSQNKPLASGAKSAETGAKPPLGSGGGFGKMGMGGGASAGGAGKLASGAKSALGVNPEGIAKGVSGLLRGDSKDAKKEALEEGWNICLRYLGPSFGLTFLGMELIVLLGSYWDIKITWWKRWAVHLVNIVIVILAIILITVIAIVLTFWLCTNFSIVARAVSAAATVVSWVARGVEFVAGSGGAATSTKNAAESVAGAATGFVEMCKAINLPWSTWKF